MATFWTCKTSILELLSLHCSHCSHSAHSRHRTHSRASRAPSLPDFPTSNETLKNPTASRKFTFHLLLKQKSGTRNGPEEKKPYFCRGKIKVLFGANFFISSSTVSIVDVSKVYFFSVEKHFRVSILLLRSPRFPVTVSGKQWKLTDDKPESSLFRLVNKCVLHLSTFREEGQREDGRAHTHT